MAQDTDQVVALLLTKLTPIELLRVASMQEAAHLSGLSPDQLAREHPDKVMKLSTRRLGMRVAHALLLSDTS
jgi:hypothetical protein